VDARFLGWDADGTRLQDAVKNTVATWARVVLDERPVLEGPTHPTCLHVTCSRLNRSRPPRDDVASVCRYLLGQADWIRSQHWAPEILDEMVYAAEQLRRMVDRPADREYIGRCDECNETLYRRPQAAKAQCRHCGAEYIDAAERRAAVMDALNDRCLTAAEIELAFTDIGNTPLTAARVRKWAQRDRIKVRGHVTVRGREHPTYLVADVADLLEAESRQKAG
jgi:ribosomal protein L37AE/L43A